MVMVQKDSLDLEGRVVHVMYLGPRTRWAT
jgi:hypothetical protein